jgi:hypothetical protein
MAYERAGMGTDCRNETHLVLKMVGFAIALPTLHYLNFAVLAITFLKPMTRIVYNKSLDSGSIET